MVIVKSSFLQVKEELDLADESTKVFKLIGPALVTQDLSEAKGNVQKRIDYIRLVSEALYRQSYVVRRRRLL